MTPPRRAQTPNDFADLRALFVEYEESLPAMLRHGTIPAARELQARFAAENAAFLSEAGCVAIERLDACTAILRHLYVKPAFRGRGAARALSNAAIGFAREVGYERLVLDTHRESMPQAYALYRSLGFSDCEPYAPVAYEPATHMELRLR